jgi:sugar phosphate isomerase/epimerase
VKLAISNLAWDHDEDAAIAQLMRQRGVGGVELAPTKVFPAPLNVAPEAPAAFAHFWEGYGIRVVALQSLLFGQPQLRIFAEPEARRQALNYLAGMIELGARLGARALIFGSPAARRIGDLDRRDAWPIAVEFFAGLGEIALRYNTCLCIEPNPPEYGCDFIRTAAEGRELVKAVNHPGFRLHLDAGALTLNGEDPEVEIQASIEWLAHFHASEPHLQPLGQGSANHTRIARALRAAGYGGWVSVEMRGADTGSNTAAVEHALDLVCAVYG